MTDHETNALVTCVGALDALADNERTRVMEYLGERYSGFMERVIVSLQSMNPNPPRPWPTVRARPAGCGPNSAASVHLSDAATQAPLRGGANKEEK